MHAGPAALAGHETAHWAQRLLPKMVSPFATGTQPQCCWDLPVVWPGVCGGDQSFVLRPYCQHYSMLQPHTGRMQKPIQPVSWFRLVNAHICVAASWVTIWYHLPLKNTFVSVCSGLAKRHKLCVSLQICPAEARLLLNTANTTGLNWQ